MKTHHQITSRPEHRIPGPGFKYEISLILLLTFLLVLSTIVKSQGKTYGIYKNNTKYGTIKIARTETEGKIKYRLIADASISFGFEYSVNELIEAVYDGGMMLSSNVKYTVNGGLKKDNSTRWNNGWYTLHKSDRYSGTVQSPIRHSVIQLYYSNPGNIKNVYSELYQCYVPVLRRANNVFCIKLPNGNVTSYHYEEGKCVKVVTRSFMFDVEFRLESDN